MHDGHVFFVRLKEEGGREGGREGRRGEELTE